MSFAWFSKLFIVLGVAAAPVALGSSVPVLAQERPAALTAAAQLTPAEPTSAPSQAIPSPTPAGPDPEQVECIAKVIMHEAAYEPRQGRVAVAQVIRSRMTSGRFPAQACDVARQRGQFFNIDAFEPARDSRAWAEAVEIATDTLNGDGEEVAPGALFFHAAYSPMPGRQRVAQIGGHVFYR